MTLPVFLTRDELGYVHVTGHRVGLADIVGFYRQGDSAEMLHVRFPSVRLSLLHKIIAFYLENQPAVDAYAAQEAEEMIRQRVGNPSNPSLAELRQRLEAKRLAQGA